MNYVSILVATVWKCLFLSLYQYFCQYNECTSHWCLVMSFWLKVSIVFVTYTIILSEMCFLHLTHPSVQHTCWAVGSRRCSARGAVGGSMPCSFFRPVNSSTLTESSFPSDPCLIHRDTAMLE